MTSIPLEEKSRIIERRIIRELIQYQAQHLTGLSMQIIAAKYSRALGELGGLPDFLESMRMRGLIRIIYSEKGARQVWLNEANEATKEAPKDPIPKTQKPKVWF